VALLLCVLPAALLGCKKDEVARVNGAVITRTQLVDQLEKDFGHQVVQRLISEMVIRQAFDKSGLQFPQQKVEEILQRERERAGSEEAFQQLLAMQGKSEDDVRSEMEMSLKLTMLAQKDIQVTDQALKDFFKENEPRYREPQRVSFSEIVLPSQQQATDVRGMATKPNASFADLAKQYSIAASQPLGGRRPTMSVEEIVPAELRDPLLALKPNQVSQPIKAGNAWVILQLHETLPAKKLTFEEARERVEEEYKAENQKINQNDLFQQLMNESTVRVVDPKYADLQRMFAGGSLLESAPGGEAGAGQPGAPEAGAAPKGGQPSAPETGAAPKAEAPAAPKAETK